MSQSLSQKRPHLIPAIAAALMLLGALASWPYGYYQILRFVVCGVGAYVAYMAYRRQILWIVWVFGFIAILFNPFIPMYLSKELWQPIDIICALLFTGVVFILAKPNK